MPVGPLLLRLRELIRELRRRRVHGAAVVYGAAVFALLQVLSVVYPALHFPDAAMTVTVVVLLAGFPVALVLGWVFDITPSGVRRTAPSGAPSASPFDLTLGGDTAVQRQAVLLTRMERLDAILEREGVLPLGRAVDIVDQLAHVLAARHGVSAVHGAVRPGQIVIAQDRRGADVVKLLEPDGTARRPGEGLSEFSSPEELAGQALDPRSDVFALGALLFVMLTGASPFPRAAHAAGLRARPALAPARLREALPGRRYPEALQRVLDRALATVPAQRQADAAILRRELLEAVAGERGFTRVLARVTRESIEQSGAGGSMAVPGRSRHVRLAVVVATALMLAAGAVRVSSALLSAPAQPAATSALAAPSSPAAQPSAPLPSSAELATGVTTFVLLRLGGRLGPPVPVRPRLVAIRDTATRIWNARETSAADRARAAFVLGRVSAALGSPAECDQWLRRADLLDPDGGYVSARARCRSPAP